MALVHVIVLPIFKLVIFSKSSVFGVLGNGSVHFSRILWYNDDKTIVIVPSPFSEPILQKRNGI